MAHQMLLVPTRETVWERAAAAGAGVNQVKSAHVGSRRCDNAVPDRMGTRARLLLLAMALLLVLLLMLLLSSRQCVETPSSRWWWRWPVLLVMRAPSPHRANHVVRAVTSVLPPRPNVVAERTVVWFVALTISSFRHPFLFVRLIVCIVSPLVWLSSTATFRSAGTARIDVQHLCRFVGPTRPFVASGCARPRPSSLAGKKIGILQRLSSSSSSSAVPPTTTTFEHELPASLVVC